MDNEVLLVYAGVNCLVAEAGYESADSIFCCKTKNVLDLRIQLTKHRQVLKTLIEDIKKSKRDGSPSIFQGILDSKLPNSEKSTERLFYEARVVVAAGTDTTATTMTKLIFHLLSNPDVLQKLKAELETALPDANALPTAAQVENLPWLVSTLTRMHN
jgi:cytochrome P450